MQNAKNKRIKGEQHWVCPETGDDVEALLCPECGMYPNRDYRCGIPFCCKFHASGIHDWNRYVKEISLARSLDAPNELLAKENTRLASRDGNAVIELCYNDGNTPFAREKLQVVDFGVADNVYVVESSVINDLRTQLAVSEARRKNLEDKLQPVLEWWKVAKEFRESKGTGPGNGNALHVSAPHDGIDCFVTCDQLDELAKLVGGK